MKEANSGQAAQDHTSAGIMTIEIVEAITAAQRRELIDFQWEIYKDNPYWVPPLISERTAFYDKRKNLFFKHSDAAFFLAYRDGRLAGTIAAIHNTRHNAKWQDKTGFFGAFECVNDPQVARALFDAAARCGADSAANACHELAAVLHPGSLLP